MLAHARTIATAGLLTLLTLSCRPSQLLPLSPEMQLTQALDSLCQRYSIVGLSVTVVSDSAVLYSRGFGLAQLGTAIPMTDSTFARVASVSKIFTALAIMQLCEQGKFSLDDDISPALGFSFRNPHFPHQPITYRQLLQHTSSLQSDEAMPAPYYVLWRTPALRLSDVLAKGGAQYRDSVYRSLWSPYVPGTQFAYSNLGYALLGTLIERHSGQRFDRYCRTHLFEPLGLKASFNVADIPPERLAYPYREVEGRWTAQADSVPLPMPAQYEVGTNALLFSPQGGLRISTRELGTLLQLFLNGGQLRSVRLLSDSSLYQMAHMPLATGDAFFGRYALGLCYADSLWSGIQMLGHSGQAYGLLSGFYFARTHRLGIAVIITGSRHRATGSAFYDVERDLYAELRTYLQAKGFLPSPRLG